MKEFKLFSSVDRCRPCQLLKSKLNSDFPEWENYIEYIDADAMNQEQRNLAVELRVMSLPSFTNNDKILYRGFDYDMVDKIKVLCQPT